jgi:hypothetical protein
LLRTKDRSLARAFTACDRNYDINIERAALGRNFDVTVGRAAREARIATWNSEFALGLRKTTEKLDRVDHSQILPDAN